LAGSWQSQASLSAAGQGRPASWVASARTLGLGWAASVWLEASSEQPGECERRAAPKARRREDAADAKARTRGLLPPRDRSLRSWRAGAAESPTTAWRSRAHVACPDGPESQFLKDRAMTRRALGKRRAARPREAELRSCKSALLRSGVVRKAGTAFAAPRWQPPTAAEPEQVSRGFQLGSLPERQAWFRVGGSTPGVPGVLQRCEVES
jgi:hypothetical protein